MVALCKTFTRGRSLRAAESAAASDAAPDAGSARPSAAGGPAGTMIVVTALSLVGIRAVPAGGPPAGIAMAAAVPMGGRPWAVASASEQGPPPVPIPPVTALSLVGIRAVPAGGAPAGIAMAAAVPMGSRPWAVASACEQGWLGRDGHEGWGMTEVNDGILDVSTE